jgi:hypothetical protein
VKTPEENKPVSPEITDIQATLAKLMGEIVTIKKALIGGQNKPGDVKNPVIPVKPNK